MGGPSRVRSISPVVTSHMSSHDPGLPSGQEATQVDECSGMHENRWRRLLPAHRPEHLPLFSSLSCWARYSGSARYHVNSTPNPGDRKNPAPRTLN
jgi:hypothetical protein